MNANSGQQRRILVTGSNGLIGRTVIDAWRESGRYAPVGLARSEGPYADIVADIVDLDALVGAMNGIDAVVHLAATSAVDSKWEAVRDSNLIGTYNVFEAARRTGVEKVIFASSNHAVGTFETSNRPELYDLDDGRVIDHTAEIQPDSLYGVSKAYGEAMGRYYVDHHGLSVVCLRIGSWTGAEAEMSPQNLWDESRVDEPDIEAKRRRYRATWLSDRDGVHLIECALETPKRWFLCYGISNNPRRFWDIEHARQGIGYNPQDSAPEEIMPGVR
ncbi:MAG TPA: NAD(P)-dependent oxidoreductase [Thermomicrobiales bacterium]|nr:NAD(P)-dependent oxidoreductase [Thermomicrobiales bacterium]